MQVSVKTKVLREVDLAQRAVAVGRKHGKTFTILQGTGKLTERTHIGDKIFVPFEEDDSLIPQEGWDRVDLLHEADIPIIDYFIMHDDPIAQMVLQDEREKTEWEPQKQLLKQALVALGAAFLGIVGVFVTGGLALAPLLLLDPGLCVVLGDERQTWVCVCTWHEGYEG